LRRHSTAGATATHLPLSSQGAAFLKIVTRDENAHVKFLTNALGSHAVPMPSFDFKATNTNAAAFMATAQVLENTGVHAYLGQGLNITQPASIKAAVSILTVEARHASVIGLLNDPSGGSIAPRRAVRRAMDGREAARRSQVDGLHGRTHRRPGPTFTGPPGNVPRPPPCGRGMRRRRLNRLRRYGRARPGCRAIVPPLSASCRVAVARR